MWRQFSHLNIREIKSAFPGVCVKNREQTMQYVREEDVTDMMNVDPFTRRAVGIRSCCGSGKTEASGRLCLAFLRRHPEGRIVYITPRVTLAENVVKRLVESTGIPFVAYNDPTVPRNPAPNGNVRHVVVQVESMHRFSSLFFDDSQPVCVIIDEFIAVLTQLASTYTQGNGGETKVSVSRNGRADRPLIESARVQFRAAMSEASSRHATTVRMFFALLRIKINYVAVFDAFLSLFAVSILRDLVGEENLDIVLYTRPPEKRTVVFVQPARGRSSEERCEPLLVLIIQMIADGKNIYVFCTSKKMVSEVKTRLRQTFGQELPIFVATGDETTDVLTDVDISWTAYRVVLTTSKVTVGVNFSIRDHFDAIFCYVMATCRNRIRDVFQALFRVRHPRTQNIFFMLDQYVHCEVMGELAGPTEQDAELLVLETCADKEPPIEVEIAYGGSMAIASAKPGRNVHLHRMRHVVSTLRKSIPEDAEILARIFARDEFETAVSTIFSEGQIETFMESCGFTSGKRPKRVSDDECDSPVSASLPLHKKPPWQANTPLPRKTSTKK